MSPERTCRETTADGRPCRAPSNLVDPETDLCPAHAEDGRERLREAARKGGEATARRLKGKGLSEDEIPPLRRPHDAQRLLEVVIRAVATGRLGHNEGRTIVRGVREFLRAHEKGQVSERLDDLLDALAEWRKTGDPEPVLELVMDDS